MARHVIALFVGALTALAFVQNPDGNDVDLVLYVGINVAVVYLIAAVINAVVRRRHTETTVLSAGAASNDAWSGGSRIARSGPRNAGRSRQPDSASAVLSDALDYARGNALTPTHIQSVEQAIRRDQKDVQAWCFAETPTCFLVLTHSGDIVQFNGPANWSLCIPRGSTIYGVAPDGTARAIGIGGKLFEGLRPATAAQVLVDALKAKRYESLTEVCSRQENRHWMSSDYVASSGSDSPKPDRDLEPSVFIRREPQAQVGSQEAVGERLRYLKQLVDEGLVSESEAAERRQAIMRDL